MTADRKPMTQVEVAELLGRSPRTLEKWRYQGRGPAYVRIGPTRVIYYPADVEKWIKARHVRRAS